MTQGPYMQNMNAIRSLTQIECAQIASSAPSAGQIPIWDLIPKTQEVFSEILPIVTRHDLTLEHLDQWLGNGLLHILHMGRLHSYDSRGPQRFRDGDYLNGCLLTRLKDFNKVIAIRISPIWDSELPEGE